MRIPLAKDTAGLAVPTSSIKDKALSAAIATISSEGVVGAPKFFLINPDSLEDSKTSNWVLHSIPGQRDPVMQWSSGGARTLAFDALVTKETSWAPHSSEASTSIGDTILNAVGNLAGAFFGVSLPPLSDIFSSATIAAGDELSIEQDLSFYRSLLLPVYNAGALVQSPPLVMLYFSTTLDDSSPVQTYTNPDNKITATTPVWVLTSLKTKVTKFLKNLRPMEATVSLQFTQYIIASTTLTPPSYIQPPGLQVPAGAGAIPATSSELL